MTDNSGMPASVLTESTRSECFPPLGGSFHYLYNEAVLALLKEVVVKFDADHWFVVGSQPADLDQPTRSGEGLLELLLDSSSSDR